MKKFKSLLVTMAVLTIMMFAMVCTVSADETTNLSDLKVYAVDATGAKTEVAMNFNSTTYEYDLTVMSDVESIEIEATTSDSTSQWVIDKDGVNTKMDTGKNLTEVVVTSATGATQKYTLNTTKLTSEEEATYTASQTADSKKTDSSKSKTKDLTVKVGKSKMNIKESFSKTDIPEGFKKSTAKYKGTKYKCIKGEVKDITAFYLYNDTTEGFYIYDKAQDKFYVMNNIKIKSRMYTIVQPEETDGIVEAYEKKTVTIIDKEVKAWVLDEEEGMYLVYAMNWNGDINLYSYDDNEKCFQRYLTSSDANKQSEAAAKAYNNLEKDYNKLVDKYNILIKVICGLAIIIIILVFVAINLGLNKKEKKIKKESKYTGDGDSDAKEDNKAKSKAQKKEAKKAAKQAKKAALLQEELDESDIDSGITIEDEDKKLAEQKIQEIDIEDIEPIDISDEVEEIETDTETLEEKPDKDNVPVEKNNQDKVSDAKSDEDEVPENNETESLEKDEEPVAEKGILGRNLNSTRGYGDEPTFGTDLESDEGFYGGEIDEEDEILIDIVDDSDDKTVADNEDDLKETMKSLLPDEQDEDEDDDDFEFIDLN
jgi:hypothetical protein